jgi:hypothetical protein
MIKIFPRLFLVLALALVFGSTHAQNGQPSQVALWLQTVEATQQPTSVQMFEHTTMQSRALPVSDADYLTLDHDQLASLLENKPAMISFDVPRDNDQTVTLRLARVNVTADDFTVGTKGTDAQENVTYKNGVHYRGIVDGDNGSIASLSFYGDDVVGFFNTTSGNYNIGRVEDETDVYSVYNAGQLPSLEGMGCYTEDPTTPVVFETDGNHNRGIGCKVVKVYFECDYALFVNKGSTTTGVVNYVTAFFNQVATLYANENIDIQISTVYVWTSSDPYASLTSTSSVLTQFHNTIGSNFNGNLAHFLTTRSLGGGIAYVDVLSAKSYAQGVSMIYGSYASVPTYSWTVECVTHELGHNLGSSHTHACSWPGGPIDNCYTPEGSCTPGPTPTNGGTIMSYCHLTSIGINFSNGFGQLPGDLIRSRVLNASSLTSSGTAPTGLTSASITSNSAVVSWVAVAGATQYTLQYKTATSSTWITATTTASTAFTISGLSAGTSYNWQVKTDCSNYSTAATFSTITSLVTSCAAPSGLSATNVSTTSATLNWGAVSGSSNYTVQYKSAASATWVTLGTYTTTATSLSGLASSTTYNWQVKSSCSTGYSTIASFTTSAPVSTTCTAPSGLTVTNVSSTSATLNWTAVYGASSYSIKYNKVGTNKWTNISGVTGTSRTITGLVPGATYQWKVKSSCNSTYSNTMTFAAITGGMVAMEANATSLDLYPNPAQNQIHVTVLGWNSDETGVADVYSVTGALLKSVDVKANDNVLMTNDLASGVYFVYVRKQGSEMAVARFVKE